MTDILKQTDTWFLVLSVVILSGYFLWSVKRLFDDLKGAIKELKDTIKELFEHRNDHETRLATIETRCQILHGKESCK